MQRLIAFEDSVFLAFTTTPPNKEMPLINQKRWTGHKWELKLNPYETLDMANIKELLNWYPWPRIIGYRTIDIGDVLGLHLSTEALLYYVPAFMLHWLYFRHEFKVADGEIVELFIPPDDEIVCEKFSGYGLRNNRYYHAFYIDRFYWFRDGMTLEQRKVCREFCTLWVPWQCHNRDFSEVEEAYNRLLSYWN